MEDKTCKTCDRWQPRYFGIGCCTGTNMPNAKLWISKDGGELLTVASFGCLSHIPIQKTEKETV